MLKTILVALLGIFFVLNGINHFYNEKTLEEWAAKRGLFSPKLSVKLAGILLVGGGIALNISALKLFGVIGSLYF